MFFMQIPHARTLAWRIPALPLRAARFMYLVQMPHFVRAHALFIALQYPAISSNAFFSPSLMLFE
jgi:hypothetical protein